METNLLKQGGFMGNESSATPVDPNKINQLLAASTKKFDLDLYKELINAISANNLEIVKIILQAKPALFHVYSEHNKSLFEIAIEKPEIFSWLIENHVSATLDLLDIVIHDLDEKITNTSSEQYKISHTKIFEQYFLGANVSLIKQENREKILGHYKELSGVVTHERTKVKEDLEYFYIDKYLIINISGLIELYRKYSSFISRSTDETAQNALAYLKIETDLDAHEIIKKLQDEILLHFETLHNIRINLLISSLKDEYKKIAKEKLALNIIKKLSTLKNNAEYCFPSGWNNHVLYLNFHMIDEILLSRIDNFGEVSKTLITIENSKRYPRVIGVFSKSDLNVNNNLLKTYLVGLFGAKLLEQLPAEQLIYSKSLHTTKVKKIDKDKNEVEEDLDNRKEIDATYKSLWPALPEQIANNCVVYNDLAGRRYRMGEKLSNLILNRLIAFTEAPVPVLPIGSEMTSAKHKTEAEMIAEMPPEVAKTVLAVRTSTNRFLRRSEGKALAASMAMHAQANTSQNLINPAASTLSWLGTFKVVTSKLLSPCFGYSPVETEETEMDSISNKP